MSLFNKDKIPNNEDKTQIYILRTLRSINNKQAIILNVLISFANVFFKTKGLRHFNFDELFETFPSLQFSKKEIKPDEEEVLG